MSRPKTHPTPPAPPYISTPSPRADAISQPPAIFSLGDVLAETYEIRALLGQGGMGQVFDAYDKNLSRRVAIKANFAGVPQSVRNEAQALAAVRHPGVVGVYALGTHKGVDYMVMEHVSGVTLAHHLERLEAAGVPLVERIDLLIAIADGLAAIHRAGISHGDVKPENILLSASGRVVLSDLGLVRAAYEPDGGLMVGTPAFMAPEIISPKFVNAGWHLIDVYAFGILAFRVLAGRLPFDAEGALELVLMHSEIEPPKLAEIVRVPKRLSELVDALMAKEPTERTSSMDAAVWQLRAAREEVVRESAQAAVPSTLTALVVDDDADIARLVAMYIKQASPTAEITIAKDAQQALDAFRKKPPRLVFLDLMMPKMSGFELFTYLRGVHLVDASTVVAMSAGGSPTDVQLMLELGAHDFIPKGPELRSRVTRIVGMLEKGAEAATPSPPASRR
jgi:serine/threonine-protein kinase